MAGGGQIEDDVDLIAREHPLGGLLATAGRRPGDDAAVRELLAAAEPGPIAQFARMGARPDLGRGRPADDDVIALHQLLAVEIRDIGGRTLEDRKYRLDLPRLETAGEL